MVGLSYVLDTVPSPLVCELEVREFAQIKNGKRVVRKIVCASLPGKREPRTPYPGDMLGMVDMHADQPECGRYQATINTARGGNAWHCHMAAL